MAQPSPKEFQPYRHLQADTEAELRRILEATAKAIQKRVATLKPGVGGQVRAAQLQVTLAAINRLLTQMWVGQINPRVARAIEASLKASEDAIEAMTRVAYAGLPEQAAEALVAGLRAAGESGLKSDAARRKRELSPRVYHQRSLDDGRVEQVIRSGLIAGLSAKELATDVYRHVSPTTPGGSSYAAMRLARTEINNAFHERQIEGAKRPGVKAVKWNLSGSHKVPDKCNVYAAHGSNGEWPPTEVPDKPHPQCFCYLTYVTLKPEDFRAKLEAGGFDDEIDRRTRENMALLGQKVGDLRAEPPKLKPVPAPKKVKKPVFNQEGYKPKAWSRVTDNEEDIQRMMRDIITLVPKDKQAENEAKDGPDWLRKTAEKFMAGVEEENEVKYENGPHRIRFTGDLAKDVQAQQQFLADFDFMQTNYPTGHDMRINVAPSTQFDFGVGGETIISTGSMFINERFVSRGKVWTGMPVSTKVSAAQYILAHEWGHSLSTKDEADESHTHNHAIEAGGLTQYGTSDHDGKRAPREGYAEAFAEWSLSKGKTKNPATLVYAEKFKWGERFGID